jgi:hypothetical protein
MSTVQRNTLVAPFNLNSPLTTKDSKGRPTTTLETTHQRWLTQATAAINDTAQVTATVPTSSASTGQPGTLAFDSNFLYIAVGLNEWRRVALSSF